MRCKYMSVLMSALVLMIFFGSQNSFSRPPRSIYYEAEALSQDIAQKRQMERNGIEQKIKMEIEEPEVSSEAVEPELLPSLSPEFSSEAIEPEPLSSLSPEPLASPVTSSEKQVSQASEIVLPTVNAQEISGDFQVSKKEQMPVAPAKPEPKKVDLDFSEANIEDVLRVIGAGEQFNIVVDPAVQGKKVSLHIKGVTAQEALQVLFHAYGLDSTIVGSTLFVSLKERIKEMGMVNRVIKLKNINAKDAEKLLENIAEEVTFNKDINAIIVTGTPSQIREIEDIISQIDRPQPQVLLTAKVLEVDRDALKELGIDWSDSMTLNFQETKRPVENDGTNQIDAVAQAFKFFRLSRDPIKFTSILKMLINSNRARILSNPQVTAMNEKEAEIFIGDRVPYTITTVTGGVASTEVRFVEAGIRLKITPSIIQEDFVVVTVEPEVSFIFAWRGPDDQYPWVRTREAKASVRVRNGQPFILGGLISEEDKKNIYRLPFLSKLPMLGKVFQYEKTTTDNKELIIAVTPEIIY